MTKESEALLAKAHNLRRRVALNRSSNAKVANATISEFLKRKNEELLLRAQELEERAWKLEEESSNGSAG